MRINLKVVNVYAPTSQSTDDEIDDFYTQLDRAVKTNAGEILMLTGDFNASLGARSNTALPGEDKARGPWGIKYQNVRGFRLHQWLMMNNLTSATSFFQPSSKQPTAT